MARPELAKHIANVLSNVMYAAVGIGGAISLANTALFTGALSDRTLPGGWHVRRFMTYPLCSSPKYTINGT
jgi:hypothetical protein